MEKLNSQSMMITLIQNVIKTNLTLNYSSVYIYGESGKKDFIDLTKSTTNKFKNEEVNFIPTSYTGFVGKKAPSKNVVDEQGTILLRFAVPNEDATLIDAFGEIQYLKNLLAGEKGTFEFVEKVDGVDVTKKRYYAYNSSPTTQSQGSEQLNGVPVVFIDLSVFYRYSSVPLGNHNKYEIRRLDDAEADFIELYRTETNGGNAKTLAPMQSTNEYEASNDVISSLFGNTITFYNDSNNKLCNDIIDDYLGKNMPYSIYELKITLEGYDPVVRYVLSENSNVIDSIGVPMFLTTSFRKPSKLLLEKERAIIEELKQAT